MVADLLAAAVPGASSLSILPLYRPPFRLLT